MRGYIVRLHSDLVNTKESVLLVCDKHYHINKGNIQKGGEIKVLRNYALHIGVHVTIFEYFYKFEVLTNSGLTDRSSVVSDTALEPFQRIE